MRRVWFRLVLIVPMRLLGETAAATDLGELVFHTFASQAEQGSFQLANGTLVSAADWRTILVAIAGQKFDSQGKPTRATCTATLVGPGLLVTAAHCFEGMTFSLKAKIKFIGRPALEMQCRVASRYQQAVDTSVERNPPRVDEDFAVCDFTLPINLPSELVDLQYEVVDTGTPLTSSSPVLMTGYGCGELTINPDGGMQAKKYDRQLRVGNGVIAVPPVPPLGNLVQIYSTTKQPALCPGDSGGPLISGATELHQVERRRVRGVNSTLDTQRQDQGGYRFVSTVAVFSAKAFTDLIKQWLDDHPTGVVCGVNGTAGVPPCAE